MEIMKAWKQKLKQFMHMKKERKITKSSHFADISMSVKIMHEVRMWKVSWVQKDVKMAYQLKIITLSQLETWV